MHTHEHRDDVRAIEALIARQFGSLTWAPGTPADWDAFAADFFPEASLYPAARPAKCQTVAAFVERTGADELMITSQIFDHQARLRSFEILAESLAN